MKKDRYPICTKRQIIDIVEQRKELKRCLFARGYFISNDANIDCDDYPFYGIWKKEIVRNFLILVHPNENIYLRKGIDRDFVLIGHAYNPFNMKYKEPDLLEDCAIEPFSKEMLFSVTNEWTGAFVLCVIEKEKLCIFSDATSMKMCNFCLNDDLVYFSSHAQLLADIRNLPMEKYARKIRATKVYNIGLRWLPGSMTAYEGVNRLGPNLYAKFQNNRVSVSRFYPYKQHAEIYTHAEYSDAVDSIGCIMKNSVALCLKKWKSAAISLTGGMDSGATLASTAGFTEDFTIFSFDCKDFEKKDSAVAKKICEILGVPHRQYHIPDVNEEIEDYDFVRAIINHNTSYIMNLSENELRKIAYLRKIHDFDVEIKSDIAEIGRTFYCRKYGMEMPEVLNERHLSVMQTYFFLMPRLLQETDKVYRLWLKNNNMDIPPFNYEHADLIYWEYRIGLSAAMTTLSLSMAHEMTFPYNNRKLLEMFLSFPHELRKTDYPQKMLMQNKMPEIVRDDLRVKDGYLTRRRILLEKLFFVYKTRFYRSRI